MAPYAELGHEERAESHPSLREDAQMCRCGTVSSGSLQMAVGTAIAKAAAMPAGFGLAIAGPSASG
jgi:hypothetical protein